MASVRLVPACATEVASDRLPEFLKSPAVGVGQNEQPRAGMGGASVARCKSRPLRIEPPGGKVPQDLTEPRDREFGDVLDDDDVRADRSDDAVELGPESRPDIVEAPPLSRSAESLAGKPSADDLRWRRILELGDVMVNLRPWTMLSYHGACVRIKLACPRQRAPENGLDGEVEPENPGE